MVDFDFFSNVISFIEFSSGLIVPLFSIDFALSFSGSGSFCLLSTVDVVYSASAFSYCSSSSSSDASLISSAMMSGELSSYFSISS